MRTNNVLDKVCKEPVKTDKFTSAFGDSVGTIKNTGMTDAEKKEFTDRVKAMSEEELELFVDLIPVDLCLKRIEGKLNRAREFEATIKNAMAGLN